MNALLSSFLSRRLVDRGGGHRKRVLAEFDALRRVQDAPRAEREAHRDRELASLLSYASGRVPWIRDALGQRSVEPSDALKVLGLLPSMTRARIQENPSRYLAGPIDGPVFDDATGGSTGTPLRFKVDPATQVAREASLMWANQLAGWSYGARIAMLWGSDRDVRRASDDWRLAARWWLDNMRWYNAFDMGPEQMASFHRAITRFRPHLLVAYAGSLQVYARYLRETGLRPRYPLRALVSSAEVLTSAAREEVTSVFAKPVFDRYGNREAGALAAEQSGAEGLRVNEAQCYLEVDSPDPYEEPGPILLTYFPNRAMPLVRYDTGDLGRFLPGRKAVWLAPVSGRQADTIRTASGRLIHGEFFTHVLYGADGVREFQFVQTAEDRYRLLLVAEAAARVREDEWRRKIGEAVGPKAELNIEYVEEIPRLASGKRRFTVSLVDTEERK